MASEPPKMAVTQLRSVLRILGFSARALESVVVPSIAILTVQSPISRAAITKGFSGFQNALTPRQGCQVWSRRKSSHKPGGDWQGGYRKNARSDKTFGRLKLFSCGGDAIKVWYKREIPLFGAEHGDWIITVQRGRLSLSLLRSGHLFHREILPGSSFSIKFFATSNQPSRGLNGSRMLKDLRYGSNDLHPMA